MTLETMIKELMALGYSQAHIARRVGIPQPTVHRAAKGSAILYDAGKKIERLHSDLVPKPMDSAA